MSCVLNSYLLTYLLCDSECFAVCGSVKQAIAKKEETLSQLREQYEKAVKRADHLEDLLEQQRKQLLGKK